MGEEYVYTFANCCMCTLYPASGVITLCAGSVGSVVLAIGLAKLPVMPSLYSSA